MEEYVARLKNKFGYSDELSNFLDQLIPNLIKYYGEEYKDIILSLSMFSRILHLRNLLLLLHK